jgi:hypothetical protein
MVKEEVTKEEDTKRAIRIFIHYPEYFSIVIDLGMGKGSKKKPMTKKEREERRKRHKGKRSK